MTNVLIRVNFWHAGSFSKSSEVYRTLSAIVNALNSESPRNRPTSDNEWPYRKVRHFIAGLFPSHSGYHRRAHQNREIISIMWRGFYNRGANNAHRNRRHCSSFHKYGGYSDRALGLRVAPLMRLPARISNKFSFKLHKRVDKVCENGNFTHVRISGCLRQRLFYPINCSYSRLYFFMVQRERRIVNRT